MLCPMKKGTVFYLVLTNKLEKSRFVLGWFNVTEPTFSSSFHELDSFGEVGTEQSRFVSLDLKRRDDTR